MNIRQGCIGQMNLFDLLPADKNEKFNPVSEYAMKGSLFVDGKKRIFMYFSENKNQSDRIKFLKKEYGVGGFGFMTDKQCIVHDAMHDAKSHEIQYNDENGTNHKMIISYAQLEREIDRLITEDKYLAKESD